MKTKKVIIIGGKGTAVNIAEGIWDAQVNHGAPVEFLGFAFDDLSNGNSVNGFPILCKTTEVWEKYKEEEDVHFIFQMNHQNKMKERMELIDSYGIPPERWFTFIHPTAFVSKSAKIGHGTVVFVGCAIHANAEIGNHCTFSALTTIGHDTIIGNHVFMSTHVCIGSYAKLGENTFFGQNSTVTGSVKIEKENLIGLGAVVVKDIEVTNQVIIGFPAKPVRTIN